HHPTRLGAEPPIHPQVISGHPSCGEPFLEVAAAPVPVNLLNPFGSSHRLLQISHDEAAHSVLHDLRYRSVLVGDHRSATSYGLNHHQPERLGPIDCKEQCYGILQELLLL